MTYIVVNLLIINFFIHYYQLSITMSSKNLFFLGLGLFATIALSAFRPWGPGEVLANSPWLQVETWDDFDADGIFVLDTIQYEQDNHWIFLAGGNLLITEHLLKCEPDTPWADTIRGQWVLENNDQRLKISFAGGGESFDMNVGSINPTQAVFLLSGSEVPNDPIMRQRIILRR